MHPPAQLDSIRKTPLLPVFVCESLVVTLKRDLDLDPLPTTLHFRAVSTFWIPIELALGA
jgi:hypothetical protein